MKLQVLAMTLFSVAASAPVRAQSSAAPALTLERALDLALDRGRDVLSAQGRVAEARALKAAARLRENPSVDAAAGPRLGETETSFDLEIGATLPLDLGGRRDGRAAVAAGGVAVAEAELDLVRREVAVVVLTAWARVAAAQAGLRVGRDAVELAESVAAAVEERRQAGAASGLDQMMAEVELAKAQSLLVDRERALLEAKIELSGLLGTSEVLSATLQADLEALAAWGAVVQAVEPVELRVLAARGERARAQASLARASGVPEVSVGAWYANEEGDHIATAGVSITLPVFDRGQGDLAVAAAHEATVTAEREAAVGRLTVAREGAEQLWRQASEATRLTRETLLPRADRALEMARDAYLAGKVDLDILLIMRHEAIDARAALQGRLLAQALAGVARWAASGAPLPFESLEGALP